jgi:hypothetical protein
MQALKIILWTIAAIVIVALFIRWSEARGAKIMEAADRYEACVRAELGTTPAAYYQEHGEYPKCETESAS